MRKRSGMMLVELVMALAITSVVVVGAGSVLRTLTHLSRRAQDRSRAFALRMIAEEEMRKLGRLGFRSDDAHWIKGSASTFSFPTVCATARGWDATCIATISARVSGRESDESAFSLVTSTGNVARWSRGEGRIRYLSDAANGGQWHESWDDSTKFPLAIELLTTHDTMLIRLPKATP